MEPLALPPGSVVVMHTHAAHGVDPKPADSDMRYAQGSVALSLCTAVYPFHEGKIHRVDPKFAS